jgi:hydrogenase expression/formation protein HypD
MRFVDEYRDPAAARRLVTHIIDQAGDDHFKFMEVCGGHTHTIYRHGIEHVLPATIELVHGPGCPVCVIPMGRVDDAIAVAETPGVLFTSFGDMMRVPGGHGNLLEAKARGADVRFVYSPLDALELAKQHPDRQVVFFAVGFETTAPANAMAVWQAASEGRDNFSVLVAHVLVPPAMEAILSSPDCRVQAFLAPGHVCTVMGFHEYEPLVGKYRVPIVVTGFEPLDLLEGIHMAVGQLESGRAAVENQYSRAVARDGNQAAQRLVGEVFEVSRRLWRGIGEIPQSGLRLRDAYRLFNAEHRFDVEGTTAVESPECISGLVLLGARKPYECPAFGTRCTPERPLGAPMVSSEGACAAYYLYSQR